MGSRSPIGSFVAALLFVAACGGQRNQEPPVGVTHSSSAGEPPEMVVDVGVRRACDLPDEKAEAPLFELDEARLAERGHAIVSKIAACWSDGRLGDGKLVVVGFTDPRGSAAYNRQLGLERALAAREALVALGVPTSSIVLQSGGERHAEGTSQHGYALDRRVEIRRERRSPRQ